MFVNVRISVPASNRQPLIGGIRMIASGHRREPAMSAKSDKIQASVPHTPLKEVQCYRQDSNPDASFGRLEHTYHLSPPLSVEVMGFEPTASTLRT
jgi:hypothetical protein